MSFQRLFYALLAVLAVYLGLYTWNLRTGVLDELAARFGLEFVGYVLRPYDRVSSGLSGAWREYADLREVRRENAALIRRVEAAEAEVAELRERAAEVERLERLLLISPPQGWLKVGARVIGARMGPAATLETVVIDKGAEDGLALNAPAMAPEGLVGRVIKLGRRTSLVLLAVDLNHSLAVMGQESRVEGVLVGRGLNESMRVEYVNVSTPMRLGETVITSGLDGVFPKGLPVAKVVRIGEGGALFQEIEARPLVNPERMEEFVLLKPADVAQAEDAAGLREDPSGKDGGIGRGARHRARAESGTAALGGGQPAGHGAGQPQGQGGGQGAR